MELYRVMFSTLSTLLKQNEQFFNTIPSSMLCITAMPREKILHNMIMNKIDFIFRTRIFPYKLITFDVNGTLLKPSEPVGATYAKFAQRHGLTAKPDAVESSFKSQYKSMCREHRNFGAESGLGWKSWWGQVVVQTLRDSIIYSAKPALRVEESKLSLIADELIDFFSTGPSWKLEKGAKDILRRLKSLDLQLGVISNTDPRLRSILKDNDLSDFFSFILISYEAKLLKPQKEIFNLAGRLYSERMGEPLKAEEAVHIGNSPDVDLLGAKRAGWQGFLLSDKQNVNCDKELVFSNLEELDEHFTRLSVAKV